MKTIVFILIAFVFINNNTNAQSILRYKKKLCKTLQLVPTKCRYIALFGFAACPNNVLWVKMPLMHLKLLIYLFKF
jgi:hypothetical protein